MTTTVLIVIGLMMAGLGLLALEVLVIPGIGVIGLLGGVGVLAAGYIAIAELPGTIAGLTIMGGVVAGVVMVWLVPRTRVIKSMVLESQNLGGASISTLEALAGREGVTLTPLRPSGTITIDGAPVDVVSDGLYIEKGTPVRVLRVEGSRVVVEPSAAESMNSGGPASPAAARDQLASPRTEEP